MSIEVWGKFLKLTKKTTWHCFCLLLFLFLFFVNVEDVEFLCCVVFVVRFFAELWLLFRTTGIKHYVSFYAIWNSPIYFPWTFCFMFSSLKAKSINISMTLYCMKQSRISDTNAKCAYSNWPLNPSLPASIMWHFTDTHCVSFQNSLRQYEEENTFQCLHKQ